MCNTGRFPPDRYQRNKKVITNAIETLDPENFDQEIYFIRIVGKTDVPYAQKINFNPMKTILFIAMFLFGNTVIAQSSARKSQFNLEHGLAIGGYDPVSYFNGKPLPGKKEYSFTFEEVTYRFANVENKRAFEKNPKKYEPQYGGWCAYAMGNDGTKVEVNPKTYKITDNKLYLFYDFYFTNTLEDWNLKEKTLKNKADTNWANFYKEKP